MCIRTHSPISQWANGKFRSCPGWQRREPPSLQYDSLHMSHSIHLRKAQRSSVLLLAWTGVGHYANATQQFLKDEGISYIPKYNNPSAVASLRPIEDFRAALKKEKYGSRWEVEDFAQLKQRILAKFCLMCSNISSAQSVTESRNARKKDIWRSTDEHCL